MSSVLFRARPQAIALALIAVGAAGCSSETTRFNDNPYAARQGEVTGTVSAAPAGRIEQTQLAPPAASRPTSAAPAAGAGAWQPISPAPRHRLMSPDRCRRRASRPAIGPGTAARP